MFVPEDGRNADNFGLMLASIAPEHVALVDRVLAPVWAELRREPSSTTVLALADHLSFAIKRVQRGIEGVFPLRAELAHLYPRELYWGEQIVAAVNAELDVELPPEEDIPIAMHLVNAAFNSGNLAFTYRMTGVFSQIRDHRASTASRWTATRSASGSSYLPAVLLRPGASDDQVDDDQGIFPTPSALARRNVRCVDTGDAAGATHHRGRDRLPGPAHRPAHRPGRSGREGCGWAGWFSTRNSGPVGSVRGCRGWSVRCAGFRRWGGSAADPDAGAVEPAGCKGWSVRCAGFRSLADQPAESHAGAASPRN